MSDDGKTNPVAPPDAGAPPVYHAILALELVLKYVPWPAALAALFLWSDSPAELFKFLTQLIEDGGVWHFWALVAVVVGCTFGTTLVRRQSQTLREKSEQVRDLVEDNTELSDKAQQLEARVAQLTATSDTQRGQIDQLLREKEDRLRARDAPADVSSNMDRPEIES